MDLPTADPRAASTPPAAAAAAAAPATPWQWPLPPGREKAFAAAPSLHTAQPCRIETQTRLTLHGELLDFDPIKRRLQFRATGGADASLAFATLRRVTLTIAWQPRDSQRSRQRPPLAAQERDYRLQQVGQDHAAPLTGRCAGHLEAAEGMYLFCPLGDAGALLRVLQSAGAAQSAPMVQGLHGPHRRPALGILAQLGQGDGGVAGAVVAALLDGVEVLAQRAVQRQLLVGPVGAELRIQGAQARFHVLLHDLDDVQDDLALLRIGVVVEGGHLRPVGLEAKPPVAQGLGIVQAEDLDVVDP